MLIFLFSFVPRGDDDPISKLVSSLQRWTDSIPQEKVYLHMDKPYYAVGDTIWFKAYVTIGSRHQLSAMSGALYVDLINEKDSVVKDLKLPITSGMAVGDFILGDEYTEGSYRIRAYTQWMRNAGPDYFFDRTFTVGEIGSRAIVTKADYQYKDINDKQVLTALLNFTNDEGRAIAERNVKYEIVINKKTVWTQTAKTDPLGSLRVNINNENKVDLSGAYIRTIIDGSDKYPIVKDFPIKAALSQSDVQFFPESGSLVNGVNGKLAFKAIGVDGLGVNLKGKIVDDAGNEVSSFETLHAGMGSCMFKPGGGKSYKANITFADGTTKTIALAQAADDGYVLSVYQPNNDSVLVRINTSQGLVSQQQNVNLIVQTNGESIFASPIKIAKPITSVWLNKKDFPTGITQFTIFNNSGEPLNERLAFIRSNDRIQLTLQTNKTTYQSKEQVQLQLEAKDSKGKPTFGNFSLSVIDESKLPVDENRESTIFSNPLLTSDLKGYVEQSNYYFTKETDEVNRALDNLMLTQGYRRFAWRELSANTKPLFKAEGLVTVISGTITTLTNKPLLNATVNLISPRAKLAEVTKSDAEGKFNFKGFLLMDSLKLTLQAQGNKNGTKIKLILDSVPKLLVNKNPNLGDVSTDIAQTIKTYIDNGKKLDDIYEQAGQLDKVHRLREVRIRASRKPPVPMYKTQFGIRIPDGHADYTYTMKVPEYFTTLGVFLKAELFNRISFITLPEGLTVPVSDVVLDGRVLDVEEIKDIFNFNGIDPESILKIDIVKSPALANMINKRPALLIYTKRDYIRKFYTPNVANILPKGFNKVREFYQPRYDKPGSDKLPDLRTTIYWNPYLKTDANGKTAFNFYNADGPGSYKVIVEGINADGELARQVYRYTVQ